ncbi:uncharacterized protein N7459_008433 [Penicillium hispanicum]|uniref:uncharacterized protein n=1 Tax=Penicillium hispanicum TaxID=1080232 RepID=UPI0025414534|nr:uncharacterized protein N7459_008433 [Penicillium hispanicum]KAJ5574006.1 hypothetical protein N7459_008433 [Penicillium hispanicum]
MANLTHNSGDGPSKELFEQLAVLNSVNPNPKWGYSFGPVYDPNPNWKPTAWHALQGQEQARYDIKAGDIQRDLNTGNGPPNKMLVLSRENALVCPVVVEGRAMCGLCFETQVALRRHLRNAHTGCFTLPTRTQKQDLEIMTGRNIMMKLVLTGAWRDADFVHEPGRGPESSLIGYYADRLEHIA